MNKTYKIQLPKNKEAQNIKTSIKDGTIEVEVELKEKWEPRDGEICYVKACSSFIAAIQGKEHDNLYAYAIFSISTNSINSPRINIVCSIADIREIRPSTDSEKQLLFDALAKKGKMWDAQKKAVVDLPRWRAEKEESYFHVFIDPVIQTQVIHATDFRCYADEKRYQLGNYFKTEEAAERVVKQIREIFKNSKAE